MKTACLTLTSAYFFIAAVAFLMFGQALFSFLSLLVCLGMAMLASEVAMAAHKRRRVKRNIIRPEIKL
jgi:hypothetical protein